MENLDLVIEEVAEVDCVEVTPAGNCCCCCCVVDA